jgi:hypothetical protein
MIPLLVEHGAPLHALDQAGYTPLLTLLHFHGTRLEMIKYLVSAGGNHSANIRTPGFGEGSPATTPLALACLKGELDLVKFLVRKCDVKEMAEQPPHSPLHVPRRGHWGESAVRYAPVWFALQARNYAVATFLVANGAALNCMSSQGDRPILGALSQLIGDAMEDSAELLDGEHLTAVRRLRLLEEMAQRRAAKAVHQGKDNKLGVVQFVKQLVRYRAELNFALTEREPNSPLFFAIHSTYDQSLRLALVRTLLGCYSSLSRSFPLSLALSLPFLFSFFSYSFVMFSRVLCFRGGRRPKCDRASLAREFYQSRARFRWCPA